MCGCDSLCLHDALPISGDDSTGVNVLGGQNPANPFYSGGWIQSGGDAQAVFDIGSLTYLNLATSGGLVTDSVQDRKSTRLNSSHLVISYAVFCLKKKT